MYVIEKKDGYIYSIGTGNAGEEISKDLFDEILKVIKAKPKKEGTIDYRLKEDLTWEAYEVESIPEPEEADPEEIINILTGEEEA